MNKKMREKIREIDKLMGKNMFKASVLFLLLAVFGIQVKLLLAGSGGVIDDPSFGWPDTKRGYIGHPSEAKLADSSLNGNESVYNLLGKIYQKAGEPGDPGGFCGLCAEASLTMFSMKTTVDLYGGGPVIFGGTCAEISLNDNYYQCVGPNAYLRESFPILIWASMCDGKVTDDVVSLKDIKRDYDDDGQINASVRNVELIGNWDIFNAKRITTKCSTFQYNSPDRHYSLLNSELPEVFDYFSLRNIDAEKVGNMIYRIPTRLERVQFLGSLNINFYEYSL